MLVTNKCIVHRIGAKLCSSWDQGQIGIKLGMKHAIYQMLAKGYLMFTGLKVSPLACKCVFYGPEHKAKGGLNEIEF